MKTGTILIATFLTVFTALPAAFPAPSTSSAPENGEAQQFQPGDDWNSLRDAYKNFPQRAARAKADLDAFLSACGEAFMTVQQGFEKAAPDFGKAMKTITDSINNAGKSFDNSRTKDKPEG